MRNYLAVIAMGVFSTAALTSPLWADWSEVAVGDLQVSDPMLRATAPNAPVAGGSVTVENRGDSDGRLVAALVEGDGVGKVERHEMTMNEGVMSISGFERGFAIAAGETVTLAPGALHPVLLGITAPLTPGDVYEVTLGFAEAVEVTLQRPVLIMADIRATGRIAGQTAEGN